MSITSDATVLRSLGALDQRAAAAMRAAHPGRVTPDVVGELRSLTFRYRSLLADCADPSLARHLRARIADTQEWLGRACDALGASADAARELERAAGDWLAAGEPAQAGRVHQHMRRGAHGRSGTIDPEYQRLQETLRQAPEASLERTSLLVELAELHSNAGDDFEAEPLLLEAERTIGELGLADAGGDRLVAALQEALEATESDLHAASAAFAGLERQVLARSLLLRVCLGLAQLERDRRPERAAEHLRRAGALDELDVRPVVGPAGTSMLAHVIPLLARDEVTALRRELDLLAVDVRLAAEPPPRLLERARALEQRSRAAGIAPFVAVALMRQADIRLAQDDPREALPPLAEAERMLDGERRHDLLPMILRARGEAYARLRAWPEVSATCASGIELVEARRHVVSGQYMRDSYLRARVDLYELGALAALITGDAPLALERAELAKARSIVRPLGAPEAATREEFERLSQRIDELRAAGADVTELLRRRRAVWDLLTIERLSAAAPDGVPELSLEALQRRLRSDEAVLYHFWLRPDRLLRATLDRTQARFEIRAVPGRERQELDDFVRTLLAQPPSVGFVDRVQRFAALALPEDRTVLEGKKRLLVSPHRVLHGLPVHALEWDGAPLLRAMAVTYVPNLTSMLLEYQPAPAGHVLAVGIHEYRIPGTNWPPLEQAAAEACDVRGLYEERGARATALVDPDATEDNLRRMERTGVLERFGRLHFATHGDSVAADTPMESFLCLRDSLLDGYEIANWRLRADLAVLSACCSGQRSVGGRGQAELPGDEPFGLQAALFAAGVRRVVGCLWKVNSAVARRIAVGLHRRLLDNEPPDVALRGAVLDHLDGADRIHRRAYYWAPFFLTALGRPTHTGGDQP